MNEQPRWLTEMEGNGQIPVMVADGDEQGAILYMPNRDAARAIKAGSHVSLVGRDMTSFDLEAERAARPRPRVVPDPDRATAPAPVADVAPQPKARRSARVGSYDNRAMVTKPGEGS